MLYARSLEARRRIGSVCIFFGTAIDLCLFFSACNPGRLFVFQTQWYNQKCFCCSSAVLTSPKREFSAGACIEKWVFNITFTNGILFWDMAEDSSGYELPRTGCLADLKPLEWNMIIMLFISIQIKCLHCLIHIYQNGIWLTKPAVFQLRWQTQRSNWEERCVGECQFDLPVWHCSRTKDGK